MTCVAIGSAKAIHRNTVKENAAIVARVVVASVVLATVAEARLMDTI